MLRLFPKRLFSADFEVFDDLTLVARLDLARVRPKGTFVLAGQRYEVGRKRLIRGAFFLKKDGRLLARATKPSALHRAFVVLFGGTEYFLEAASPFRRAFVLSQGPNVIGTIAPEGVFSRRAQADLPADLPLEVQIFLTWLVLLTWKRQRGSS